MGALGLKMEREQARRQQGAVTKAGVVAAGERPCLIAFDHFDCP
jgi:hypothetical protein